MNKFPRTVCTQITGYLHLSHGSYSFKARNKTCVLQSNYFIVSCKKPELLPANCMKLQGTYALFAGRVLKCYR